MIYNLFEPGQVLRTPDHTEAIVLDAETHYATIQREDGTTQEIEQLDLAYEIIEDTDDEDDEVIDLLDDILDLEEEIDDLDEDEDYDEIQSLRRQLRRLEDQFDSRERTPTPPCRGRRRRSAPAISEARTLWAQVESRLSSRDRSEQASKRALLADLEQHEVEGIVKSYSAPRITDTGRFVVANLSLRPTGPVPQEFAKALTPTGLLRFAFWNQDTEALETTAIEPGDRVAVTGQCRHNDRGSVSTYGCSLRT